MISFPLKLPLQNVLFVSLLLFTPLLLSGCDERTQPEEEIGETMMNNGETILNADLSGEMDGDPEGSGFANVIINSERDEVCYEIEVSGIDEPTMAHIHEGAAGESGGVVVDFNTPENGMNSCIEEVDSNVIQDITENPGNYYVNVHNAEYPAGAIRGQLAAP